MLDITLIDPNFLVKTDIDIQDVRFLDVNEAPFSVHGVAYDAGKFRRLPAEVAKTVNPGVFGLHAVTSGGRVRFKTNSPYIVIHAQMPSFARHPHFPLTGGAGFDLYVSGGIYKGTFVPPLTIQNGFDSVLQLDSTEMREITINFPLYGEVSELFIGICNTAEICPPEAYEIQKPIVYYGSSITMGGCASRPGNSYEAIVSRRLNADYLNLGFSGSAKGETEIAEYISRLDMSAFVYDYDYNAPTTKHLRDTHEKMFQMVRQAQPELPILILPRPKLHLTEEEQLRLEIITETYQNAVKNGDRNVYLLDNKALTMLAGCDGTVDNCHPNDLGFASMAKAVGDLLETILK